MKYQNPPDIFSLEYSKPHLEPLRALILESFWEAWGWSDQFIAKDERARIILNTSSIAGIVSDAFGYFAFPKIQEQGARLRKNGRAWHAVVNEALLVRFKKMTADLHTMNVETGKNTDIVSHRELLLPGGRALTTINLGYTVSRISQQPTGVYFACPDGAQKNHWVWPIYQSDDGQQNLFVGSPPSSPSGDDVSEPLNVDIRIKRRKAKHG